MAKVVADPAQFRAALEAAGRVLDAAGIIWWIQDGTLLGAIRNGGPIPGDVDIDLGIHATAYRPALIDDLLAAGFTIHKSRGVDDDDPLFIRTIFRGVPLDIFGMYESNDGWHYTCAFRRLKIQNWFAPFTIGRTGFLGLDVPCPQPAEAFLAAEYGKEWRTPTSDWHYAFSPGNLRVVGGPVARLIHRLRYVEWRLKVGLRGLRHREEPAVTPESGLA